MKHSFLLLALFFCVFLTHAQVSKTIDVTSAGTLTALLTSEEKTTITHLTVTGNINAQDVRCMRNEITNLAVLDLSQTVIQEYTGSNGTASGTVTYPANEMPAYSFFNSVTESSNTSLTSINFPQSMTSVGEYACNKCSELIELQFYNNLKEIKGHAFGYLNKITSLTLPNSLEIIGGSSFWFSSSIVNLVIPNSVTSIGSFAFAGMYNVETITISNNVNELPRSCFSSASKLNTIISLNPIPPSLEAEVFKNCPLIAEIYVPNAAVSSYKIASGWGDGFYDKIFAIPSSSTIDLSVNYNPGGSVKDVSSTVVSGSVVTIDEGSNKTFTIVPLAGYIVSAMTYNSADVLDQLVNNQYTTPNVDSDATLNVTFEKVEYKLSIESAENGAVVMLCAYGATPSFQFTPSAGWKLHTVYYNGVDVTSQIVDGKYTIPAIDADGALNVSYVSDSPTLAPTFSSSNIQVYNSSLGIVVSGVPQGETVSLYGINGALLKTEISGSNNLVFPAQKGTIYIVKTQHKAFKVIF